MTRKSSHQRFHERMGFSDDYDIRWIMFGSQVRIGVIVVPKVKDQYEIAYFRKKALQVLDEMLPPPPTTISEERP